MMRTLVAVLSLSILISITACGSCVAATKQAGTVEVENRVLKTKSGDEIPYELGTLYVPENRSVPNSRVIGVGFVRFPAEDVETLAPPVFRLPGGPGSSFLSRLKAAEGKDFERYLPVTAQFRKFCDVVLVDQRGFSEHGDVFKATLKLPSRQVDSPTTDDEQVAAFKVFARESVAKYADGNVDLRGYTVIECAQDVADLRKALGYEKIVLTGSSFGSQWSFAVMRQHPQIVARAMLSGIEPLDHGYDMPSHVFAALQRMWRTVDQDERFKPYLPEGGIAEAARVLIERLEQEPIRLEVDNPATGEKRPAGVLGPRSFPWHEPALILEMYHGRTDKWRVNPNRMRPRLQSVNLIWPLIDTSLNVTPERQYRLGTDPATRYLGRGFARYTETAHIWPSPDVGEEFRTPIISDIPVVFAQGNWDTQTPIENTLEIAPFFPNSRMLIAERGGHGVLDNILWEKPKAWKELEQFVRSGDMNEIPVRVELKPSRRFEPPTFALPAK